MKTFVFDIDKAVAAAAYLARKQPGRQISVFILLKMLYSAERRALLEWHRPITGDSFCSMAKGPVLSRIYDLIKGRILGGNSDMQKWSQHFSPPEGNLVQLLSDPDYDFLSPREREALDQGFKEIQTLERKHGMIAGVLHARWPEWKDPKISCGKGSAPIELAEILEQSVDDEDEIQRILLEIQSVQSAKAALQTT